MEDNKSLQDYDVKMLQCKDHSHQVLHLETKSSWLMHFIHLTRLYPGLISRNMSEDLMQMYKGEY